MAEFGGKPVKYGIEWPRGTSRLTMELYCLRVDQRGDNVDGRLSSFDHYKNAVDIIFNGKDSVRKHVWSDESVKMATTFLGSREDKRFVGVAGNSSCVAGETRLLDPVNGGGATIQEYCERGERPWVQTLNGPVLADVPYLKGRTELFEVAFSNGGKITCTAEHRMLTLSGWKTLRETSVGDSLVGYVSSLPPTTSGNGLSNRLRGALRYFGRAVGFQGGCHPSPRFCGAVPHVVRELARDAFPSQGDVPRCKACACVHSDDRGSESGHSHPCPEGVLSKRGASLFSSLWGTFSRCLSVVETSLFGCSSFRLLSRSLSPATLPLPFGGCRHLASRKPSMDCVGVLPEESERPSFSEYGIELSSGCPFDRQQAECSLTLGTGTLRSRTSPQTVSSSASSWDTKVTPIAVESIISVGVDDFYDLNVPTEHHYFAEGVVSHNSGKSDTLGLFCIIMYLSAPANTLCLLTSTTLEDAKGRVWKGVREYWTQVERFFGHSGRKVPGSPVHSKGRIRGLDGAGNYTDTTGLRLIAADRTKGDDATSKLMGIKAPGDGLLILGADELPDLSSSILTVAFTNLVNNPRFWMYGLGNPNLKLDAHGRFCEPKEGWDAVSHNPMEWDTERGKVIRFESEDSSRIREEDDWSEAQKKKKKTRFFWQPSRKTIEAAAKQWGRTSRAFLRMYSARWSSAKAPNAIYSESELMRAAVDEPAWDSVAEVVMVSGLDSSYTSGGDRSVCVDLMCGRVKGVKHAHIARIQNLMINDRSDVAPSHQIVRAWMKHCQQRGVRPKAAGFDNSGSGVSFGSIVEMEWSVEVKKINFGGQPSGRLYRLDGDTAMDFANRMSELWVQPKQFIRGYRTPDGEYVSQLTGLTPELIEEMVNRQYDDAGEGAKLKVEQKRKMRDRTGSSPDVADAFFIAIEVAIQNGWLDSQEEKKILKKVKGEWEEQRKRLKYKTRRGRNMTF